MQLNCVPGHDVPWVPLDHVLHVGKEAAEASPDDAEVEAAVHEDGAHGGLDGVAEDLRHLDVLELRAVLLVDQVEVLKHLVTAAGGQEVIVVVVVCPVFPGVRHVLVDLGQHPGAEIAL